MDLALSARNRDTRVDADLDRLDHRFDYRFQRRRDA
jgi:hypothetical protein